MVTRIRRRVMATVLGALVITIGSPASSVATETPSSPRLQEAVQQWASEIGAPGMTAQIVDTNGVLSEAMTGIDGRGQAVDTETPFVWGSVSKQFTAATVVALERENTIDETAAVVDVVPQA